MIIQLPKRGNKILLRGEEAKIIIEILLTNIYR